MTPISQLRVCGCAYGQINRLLVCTVRRSISANAASPDLQLVGQLPACPTENDCTPYSFFVHKRLGYRGLILSTWQAPVFEHRFENDSSNLESDRGSGSVVRSLKTVVENTGQERYYTVLVDERDIPRCAKEGHSRLKDPDKQRAARCAALSNSVEIGNPFLTVDSTFCRQSVVIDVVPHDDVLPCALLDTEDHRPFLNVQTAVPQDGLTEGNEANAVRTKDAMPVVSRLHPTAELKDWYSLHSAWIETAALQRQSSRAVTVQVMPFYRGASPVTRSSSSVPSCSEKVYKWSFVCRVESDLEHPVGLLGCAFVVATTTGARVKLSSPLSNTSNPIWLQHPPGKNSKQRAILQFSGSTQLESRNPTMYGRLLMTRGQDRGEFFEFVPPVPMQISADTAGPKV